MWREKEKRIPRKTNQAFNNATNAVPTMTNGNRTRRYIQTHATGTYLPNGCHRTALLMDRTYMIIDKVCRNDTVELVCALFEVPRSCLYAYRERSRQPNTKRMALRSRVQELFVESRSSAGSRSIMGMMREDGVVIGRFKVSRLMEELGLISKQPGKHAYKLAAVERIATLVTI